PSRQPRPPRGSPPLPPPSLVPPPLAADPGADRTRRSDGVARARRAVRRVLWSGRLAALPRPAAIHLGLPSPAGSSGPPAGSGGSTSHAHARRLADPHDLSSGC